MAHTDKESQMICQRCGGHYVAEEYGDKVCFNCGAREINQDWVDLPTALTRSSALHRMGKRDRAFSMMAVREDDWDFT